jgi:hypothetical protein
MKRRVVLFTLSLSACLALFYACAADKPVWQGFQGAPVQGLHAYAAQVRTSDTRGGDTAPETGALFVAQGRLRYEMQGSGPLERLILLARLDTGQAWLVNPTGNRYMEGRFAPRRWTDIGYLLEAFPKVAHSRVLAHNEEVLGKETLDGYMTVKIRRTGREVLFGEERDFTELFWLAEEFCIPLRHENGMVRSELTQIREQALADSLFTLPAECRKVFSFADLLP